MTRTQLLTAIKWIVAIWLAVCGAIVASAIGAEIVGPTESVEPKQPVWLEISDVADGSSAAFFPSKVLDTNATRIKPGFALFWTDEPGTYVVNAMVIDWESKQFTPLMIEIVVEGDDDTDPPLPDPEPTPGGPYQIMMFNESGLLDNLPFSQRAILTSSKLQAELAETDHVLLGIFDPDSTGSSGRGEYQTWWDAIEGHALPCVALAPVGGGDIEVVDLPADVEAFWELIGGAE